MDSLRASAENSVALAERPACFPFSRKAAKVRDEDSPALDEADKTWVVRQGPSEEGEVWDVPPEETTTSGTMISEAKRGPPEPHLLFPERSSPELWEESKRVGRHTVEDLTTRRTVRPPSKL